MKQKAYINILPVIFSLPLIFMTSCISNSDIGKSYSFYKLVKDKGVDACLQEREASARMSETLDFNFQRSSQYPAIIFKKGIMENKNDWSQYETLKLEVKNNLDSKAKINIRIDDADKVDPVKFKNCIQTKFILPADGKYHTIYINLRPGLLNSNHMRGMPRLPVDKYGYFFRGDPDFNLKTVKSINIFRVHPREVCSISIRKFELSTKRMSKDAFVDKYGQFSYENWKGKILSDADLRKQLDAEKEDNKKYVDKYNSNFDAYGGWDKTPKQFKKTGHFRTEKVNGKWWFVDPDGKLFWSLGICRAKTLSLPIVAGEHKALFEFLPEKDSEFGKYYMHNGKRYNFFEANLQRKLGPGFKRNLGQYIGDRMRSWGFNSRGAWTDGTALTAGKPMPFTITIKLKFTDKDRRQDVYSETFIEELHKQFKWWRKYINNNKHIDPYIIGIFVDNEIRWDRLYTTNTYEYVQYFFKKSGTSETRNKCVELMQEKYGDISNLNNVWNTNFENWEAMKSPFSFNSDQLAAAKEDISAMTMMIAEKYYSTCKEASRKYFPNKLYLGSRLCTWNRETLEAANKYCDVVSYNLYTWNPSKPFAFYPNLFEAAEKYDKPILIGEFHFGAVDRGTFHGGLRAVKTQRGRGLAYTGYIGSALSNPYIIGAHWFQYQDQPITGRGLDRENYSIGFVSIADTPYHELIEAARKINFKIYQLRYYNEK